eukprot:TRINITY_DN1573_c0_g1_i8.p1 TRINITY_DN1573_c0_g1~~TRINITY_DN1573_c0_g1_i8.p1  ORF type:complete len:621 (+),score=147.25 TRINITY_DN1573_c0_g1_i8:113-1975(+)
MILLRALRPDKVINQAVKFINSKKPSVFDMTVQTNELEWALEHSSPSTPILFILTPGVDPYPQLENLSTRYGKDIQTVSLGKGQSDKAKEKITDGSKAGSWVYLANCHLSMQFLLDLEKIIETLGNEKNDGFRLWLSSNPHPRFPISILQRCLKITREPPRGLKNNMLSLYSNMKEKQFVKEKNELNKYKKLLYSLCWFHSVIIERKRFKSLGWNILYDFNDSDFSTCEKIIVKYLKDTTDGKVPWAAIRYLIAEANYGGRVTDEWDRRLLMVYANQFFNEKVLTDEKYFLTDDPTLPYFIPDDAGWKPPQDMLNNKAVNLTQAFYEMKIKELPSIDTPAAFGQHINAEISSQIADTNLLIDSIISLQPKKYIESDETTEGNPIDRLIVELLERIPDVVDVEMVKERIRISDANPLKIVLVQELMRYNKLLEKVRSSLMNLDRGLKGFILISEELENILNSLMDNRVPASWKFAYHSLKPLSSWVEDLIRRIDQLTTWAHKGMPTVFWISGFTFPTGFTTAVKQASARAKNVSVDTLDFEYTVMMENPVTGPKEGVYINGLFLEGARWDHEKGYLIDAEPMKLHYSLPVIHIKPKNIKLVTKKHFPQYLCPVYMLSLIHI